MPLRNGFRRRALSNATSDERPSRQHLHSIPSPPLPFFSGLTTSIKSSLVALPPRTEVRDAVEEEDTLSEVYASIWRQSSHDQVQARVGIEVLTPPASPSRFTFTPSPTHSFSRLPPSNAKQGQASQKKSLTTTTFLQSNKVVGSLLRWREKKKGDSKASMGLYSESESLTLQPQSFLDFDSSRETLLCFGKWDEGKGCLDGKTKLDCKGDVRTAKVGTSQSRIEWEPARSPLRRSMSFSSKVSERANVGRAIGSSRYPAESRLRLPSSHRSAFSGFAEIAEIGRMEELRSSRYSFDYITDRFFALQTHPGQASTGAQKERIETDDGKSDCSTSLSSPASSFLYTPRCARREVDPQLDYRTPFQGYLHPLSSTPPASPTTSKSTQATFLRLHSSRSFATLRNSLTWEQLSPPVSPTMSLHRPTQRKPRNPVSLPPPVPPPEEELPLPPVPSLHLSRTVKHGERAAAAAPCNLEPAFLQWDRELKEMSDILAAEKSRPPVHPKRPCSSTLTKQQAASSLDVEVGQSTPSTVTPSMPTPRKEAFEFDLDDPLSNRLPAFAPSKTKSALVDYFPRPPLRLGSVSSHGKSSVNDTTGDKESTTLRSSIASFHSANSYVLATTSRDGQQSDSADESVTTGHSTPSTNSSSANLTEETHEIVMAYLRHHSGSSSISLSSPS